MFAIKQARKFIENHPDNPQSTILVELVLALQSDQPYSMSSLFELDIRNFDLALEIVKEWRLDRYYAKKERLLEVVHNLSQPSHDKQD